MYSTPLYPNLVGQMAARGISRATLAATLKCAPKTLYYKLNGRSQFTWNEVCLMRNELFPDLEISTLMYRSEGAETHE